MRSSLQTARIVRARSRRKYTRAACCSQPTRSLAARDLNSLSWIKDYGRFRFAPSSCSTATTSCLMSSTSCASSMVAATSIRSSLTERSSAERRGCRTNRGSVFCPAHAVAGFSRPCLLLNRHKSAFVGAVIGATELPQNDKYREAKRLQSLLSYYKRRPTNLGARSLIKGFRCLVFVWLRWQRCSSRWCSVRARGERVGIVSRGVVYEPRLGEVGISR